MEKENMNSVNMSIDSSIFGTPIFSGRRSDLMNVLTDSLQKKGKKKPIVVFTPNPEQLRLTLHNATFKHTLQQASVNIPDGSGVVWALHREGHREAVRIAGRELFHDLLCFAKTNGQSVLLIGGRVGSGALIIEQYGQPARWVADPGAKDIRNETLSERERVRSLIQEVKPDMVFVAYGAPWQEEWVIQNNDVFTSAQVGLVMVVGGAFEYEAGRLARVPGWLVALHLEWAYRLLQEPWRWKRQLLGLEFFLRVLLG